MNHTSESQIVWVTYNEVIQQIALVATTSVPRWKFKVTILDTANGFPPIDDKSKTVTTKSFLRLEDAKAYTQRVVPTTLIR